MNKILTVLIGIILAILIVWLVSDQFIRTQIRNEQMKRILQTKEAGVPKHLLVKHQYLNGNHTLAGNIKLENICFEIEAKIVSSKEDEKKATLLINTKSLGEKDSCYNKEPIVKPFVVNFIGPEEITFDALLNGEKITLNITPILSGDNIQNTKIYIKE